MALCPYGGPTDQHHYFHVSAAALQTGTRVESNPISSVPVPDCFREPLVIHSGCNGDGRFFLPRHSLARRHNQYYIAGSTAYAKYRRKERAK